ncbi:MAG: MBL fold metallo-hydrolase [Pirellulaceae bacterium]|nr:metal-dependent hydrolase [Planctomycetales bacterium]
MVKNAAFHQIDLGDISLEGYSRAAVQSYWRIPEWKVGFDLGAQPWDFMGTPTWFLTHAHLDHIAALPVYVARRRMMKMEPPVIYLPESAVGPTEAILRNFSRLDRGRLPCSLVPLAADSEYELSRELVVTAHPTVHSIPSFGFVIWHRRRKLKPEYQGLSGDQIRDLRLAGTEVTAEQRFPLLGYTGDTSPAGLDQNPVFYQVKYLITEMTFLAKGHRREKIHKHGHMHLDDFRERIDRFENEKIILGHFSVRYSRPQISKFIERAFPTLLDGRMIVCS